MTEDNDPFTHWRPPLRRAVTFDPKVTRLVKRRKIMVRKDAFD